MILTINFKKNSNLSYLILKKEKKEKCRIAFFNNKKIKNT